MPVPAEWIADYYPIGNAVLTFNVGTGLLVTEAATGNAIEAVEEVDYLAAVTLTQGDYTPNVGSDSTAYEVRGKLLRPRELDPRIGNGSTGVATINGVHGRIELVFDAAQNSAYISDIRQTILGTFRVVGGKSS